MKKVYTDTFLQLHYYWSLFPVLLMHRLLLVPGKINIRVGEYGEIRIFTTEGVDTVQHINRISLIAAGNTDQVIDYWNDLDIEVPTELVASPTLSDYEVSGTYNNAYSGLPPNFLIEQNVYGWSDQSYIVVKCVITNQETSEMPM